jgi:Prophage minor tail protein Z (GPZ)
MTTVSLDVAFDFSRLHNLMKAAGARTPGAIDRAVNRTAEMARTKMVKVLVPQTGLKYRAVRSALRLSKAKGGSNTASVLSRGGDIRLRFFGPRVVGKAGVSAAPRSKRQIFKSRFMRGGLYQSGKAVLGGKTPFERVKGAVRLPIRSARSGVYIPEEMITNASAEVFHDTVARVLPERLSHELGRALG